MALLGETLGRTLSGNLGTSIRGLTQTPGPNTIKSKIPGPEKYDGKRGPVAKSFMLECKAFILANQSSFPSDHAKTIYVLMKLKEGQPRSWGQ